MLVLNSIKDIEDVKGIKGIIDTQKYIINCCANTTARARTQTRRTESGAVLLTAQPP